MKSNFNKIIDFAIDFLKDYLIDKAVGTFLVSIIVDAICFFLVTQTAKEPAPPHLAIAINKIFAVLGVVSFITSIITVFPALYKFTLSSLDGL